MNRWDVVLLLVAGYVATAALVRLMIRRRNELLDELRRRFKMRKMRKEANKQEDDNLGQQRKAA
jgi:hypothetical protein